MLRLTYISIRSYILAIVGTMVVGKLGTRKVRIQSNIGAATLQK